jgi:hypothetical protein
VHGNPADLSGGGLGLSGMQTRPDRNAELGDCCDDCVGGAHRLGRLIKGGKEAVSSGIELSAAEPAELSPNRSVVGRHQPLPRLVTESDCQIGRPHDVREEDGRKQPLWRPAGSKQGHCRLEFRSPRPRWQRLTSLALADGFRFG